MKLLYQPYIYREGMDTNPFKYIETGYIRGFEKAGCDVVVWDNVNYAQLEEILDGFKPDLFVGYIRAPRTYEDSSWMQDPIFYRLNSYRQSHGMKVALHTNPDVQTLTKNLDLHFTEGDRSCADKFYQQKASPTKHERMLIEESFVDLILHSFSRTLTQPCFKSWLSAGIDVLEEPLALDDTVFKKTLFPRSKSYDLSYAGGWWPFKGQQLDKYLFPMKDHFGVQLGVFGKGWPHLSEGHVSDKEFIRIVRRSKINLVFHEPSQVQKIPVHVNERIYKLYGMGGFALCDNNPCLKEYFNEDEIVFCSNPEEMIDKAEYYLKNKQERVKIAENGHRAVMARHTYYHRASALISRLFN